jgi:nonsense-mediated mRNA decay protein 3
MAFCPNCGKTTEKGFCDDCRPPADLKIKDIYVKICSACGKYFYRNRWVAGRNEDAITRIAKEAVKDYAEISFDISGLKQKPGIKSEVQLTIERGGDVFGVPAKVEFTYCEACAKKQGQYFEGTLQLRNVSDDMMDFADRYLKNNHSFASNTKEVKDGYDLDISDQKKLQTLGQQLKKNFGGILKVSIRQFTQDKLSSKQIYRVNVLYEGPKYRKGEVIRTDKGIFLLTNVSEKVSAIDLKTGKKSTIDISEKETEVLPSIETRISKVYPHIEVMDPETFQNVIIQNRSDVKAGEKVKVVNDNGLFYIVG